MTPTAYAALLWRRTDREVTPVPAQRSAQAIGLRQLIAHKPGFVDVATATGHFGPREPKGNIPPRARREWIAKAAVAPNVGPVEQTGRAENLLCRMVMA